MDFVSGLAEVEEEERNAIEPVAKNIMQKIWFALA